MYRLLLPTLLAASSSAHAVVIRDDVDEAKYRVTAAELPALVDLPGEGHGVLIAPRWVVSAAHAVTWQERIDDVTIQGVPRKVARLIVHPGFRKPSQGLIDQALASGDATLVRVLLASSDDIALLELAEPVTDVEPARLYAGTDEMGRTVELVGKGATGNGAVGYGMHAPHRTQLRRAYNQVSSVDGRWLCYVFDKAPAALPLEGMTGSGDSGGAVLVDIDGQRMLAGLPSWSSGQGDVRTLQLGLYGQTACNVRLSHYAGWIAGQQVAADGAAGTANHGSE